MGEGGRLYYIVSFRLVHSGPFNNPIEIISNGIRPLVPWCATTLHNRVKGSGVFEEKYTVQGDELLKQSK